VQNQMELIEYDGELLPDGHLSVPDNIFKQLQPGQKPKVKIECCRIKSNDSTDIPQQPEANTGKIASTKNLLEACYHDMLRTVDRDWSDWLSPDEDVYEEYRRYVR